MLPFLLWSYAPMHWSYHSNHATFLLWSYVSVYWSCHSNCPYISVEIASLNVVILSFKSCYTYAMIICLGVLILSSYFYWGHMLQYIDLVTHNALGFLLNHMFDCTVLAIRIVLTCLLRLYASVYWSRHSNYPSVSVMITCFSVLILSCYPCSSSMIILSLYCPLMNGSCHWNFTPISKTIIY